MMRRSNEYLARRLAINEAALKLLGDVIMAHLPGTQPQLRGLSEWRDSQIAKLDAGLPA